ncbi:MAG: PIN domain-containing protein [Oligoflexales bacterium]|nr:PIN domain-containing protein [Oligoflexales bacterium]
MVLVDTSVWIDLFSTSPSLTVPVEKLPLLVTCNPVIQEILQGIRDQKAFQKVKTGMLSLRNIMETIPLDVYLHAADIYRAGRLKGLTIRSSVDCLIAAIALRNNLVLWHKDRNFDAIAKYTELRVIQGL